tara:strand:- start:376 stop:510 length:135 start_codon:yes stop_codon:yes gene_type:complete
MKIFIFLISVLVMIGISGCETMEGLGKDIKTLGDKIEKKASSTE